MTCLTTDQVASHNTVIAVVVAVLVVLSILRLVLIFDEWMKEPEDGEE